MIHYSKVTTKPVLEPVSLAEARLHLNIDGNEQDALIMQKVRAATSMCERYAGLSFMTQTRRVSLDRFCGDLKLPYGPVQSVESFEYIDADGNDQTYSDYTLSTEGGVAFLRPVESWPYTDGSTNNTVIEYIAGVSNSQDVPYEAKEAILRLLTKLFENRGDSAEALMGPEITDLLDEIKVYWYAG